MTVTVYGGDEPHVGAAAIGLLGLAWQIRKRLVLPLRFLHWWGHKDDEIAKPVAKILAAQLKKLIVVVVGVHLVSPTTEQINTVMDMIPEIAKEILHHFPS